MLQMVVGCVPQTDGDARRSPKCGLPGSCDGAGVNAADSRVFTEVDSRYDDVKGLLPKKMGDGKLHAIAGGALHLVSQVRGSFFLLYVQQFIRPMSEAMRFTTLVGRRCHDDNVVFTRQGLREAG